MIIPTTTNDMDQLALLRLMQLVSPALPIGAFNFSQGLEYAIETGWINSADDACAWIEGVGRHGVGTLDLPLLARMHEAWLNNDTLKVLQLSQALVASRETAELRAEDRHLGRSLAKVLSGFGMREADAWHASDSSTFATLFSLAAARSQIPIGATLAGYLWAWCENQTIAAVKLLPLGQTAGQRILEQLRISIPDICEQALLLDDDSIGAATPGVAIASALHETQYTRLFRS